MSTFLANRVQTAHPRSINRSSSSIQGSQMNQRPISSMAVNRSQTDMFDIPSWRTSSTAPLDALSNRSRAKTASVNSTANLPFTVGQLRKDEVQSLVRSLDREDTFIVQVNCLADYRKLVHSINLRRTPVEYKSLCALQQRENRIVQRNACRDARFRSLIESLSPAHSLKLFEANPPNVKPITTKS